MLGGVNIVERQGSVRDQKIEYLCLKIELLICKPETFR